MALIADPVLALGQRAGGKSGGKSRGAAGQSGVQLIDLTCRYLIALPGHTGSNPALTGYAGL